MIPALLALCSLCCLPCKPLFSSAFLWDRWRGRSRAGKGGGLPPLGRAGLASVCALALVAAFPCLAADEEAVAATTTSQKSDKGYLPWEKGSVKFGGFISAFDSTLSFGVNHSVGVSFNAEELFDLESSLTVFRAEAMYRPGKSLRNQLDFTYASYERSGGATLSQDITINGVTYPVGAHVESVFNFDIIRGTYSYAILQDERMRIALGLGVYAVPLKYGLTIDTTGGRSKVEGADTTLPLPALALRGEFQLIPRLFLYTSLDAMYLEISDFKGSLLDVNVGLEYRPWKHIGFGAGYNGMSVQVEGENSSSHYPGTDFVGSVGVRFTGLMLYGKVSF